MSTNCVRCVCKQRTGNDLMCNDCRDAHKIVAAINGLRNNEGASVLICCENPEGTGLDNEAVEVCDDWTNWQPLRFTGRSLEHALTNAVMAKYDAENPIRAGKARSE